MFCYIKYSDKSPSEMSLVECFKHETVRPRSLSSSRKSQASMKDSSKFSSNSSITSKNKLLMVNPDCYVQILIEYIYEQINLDSNIKFDLCDENGVLLKMYNLKPQESASKLLKDRQTYVVVVYEKDDNDSLKCIEPLIYRSTKQDNEFYVKFLRNLSTSLTKLSGPSSKKGTKSSGSLVSKKSKSTSRTGHRKQKLSASQHSRKSAKSN